MCSRNHNTCAVWAGFAAQLCSQPSCGFCMCASFPKARQLPIHSSDDVQQPQVSKSICFSCIGSLLPSLQECLQKLERASCEAHPKKGTASRVTRVPTGHLTRFAIFRKRWWDSEFRPRQHQQSQEARHGYIVEFGIGSQFRTIFAAQY